MAVWYFGSDQYALVPQWAAGQAVSVGAFRRQLATPTVGNERVWRCTTAGTTGGSEPSWTLTKGSTTNDNGVVWTEVTGNSAYGWSAAGARWTPIVTSWAAAGDTCWVSKNHDETSNLSLQSNGSVNNPIIVIAVDPAGSVPPVGADYAPASAHVRTSGANNVQFGWATGLATYGVCFHAGSGGSAASIRFDPLGSNQPAYFRVEDGLLDLASANLNGRVEIDVGSFNSTTVLDLVNTPINFTHASQTIDNYGGVFNWKNTPGAITGTVPTTLITSASKSGISKLDGVDLSAFSGNIVVGSAYGYSVDLTNCKLHASAVPAGTISGRGNVIRMINCSSGAQNYKQYKKTMAGVLTEETTIVRSGGASDGVTPISQKIVTTADAHFVVPFASFPISVWNGTTGAPITVTVEAVNDGTTLTDAEFWIEVEELGDGSFPLASGKKSRAGNPIAVANVPTSSVTWTTTGLTTPVKQHAQVTFTPAMKGYLRITAYIARPSKTVYICPLAIIT